MLSKRICLVRGAKERGDETKRCDEESLQFTNTGQSLSIKEFRSLLLSKDHQS